MPFLRFDLIEGRSDTELQSLLDAAHRAMVCAFNVPPSDRYQVVHEHRPGRMIAEDTGLGIVRTRNLVILSVTSRPRAETAKVDFYTLLVAELEKCCGIGSNDVIVNLVTNTDADWSFGHGKAQFLTGEL